MFSEVYGLLSLLLEQSLACPKEKPTTIEPWEILLFYILLPKAFFSNVFLKVSRITSQLMQTQILVDNPGEPIKLEVPLTLLYRIKTHQNKSAKNGSHKTVKSDESSLNHSLVGPFLAQGMFFGQNKCLEWIQNHNKPLV